MMKRAAKNLFAFGLALTFVAALWCADIAAPGQAIASVAGCDSGPMEMPGCDQFLCGLESSANLLSQGALTSARYDLSKSTHGLFVDDLPSDTSEEASLIGKNSEQIFLNRGPDKVSTHLLNSILNL